MSIFPSDTLTKIVSPTTSTQTESFPFDITPTATGEQSIEVQLWQDVTMVDSYLLTFMIFESMDPTLHSFWVFNTIAGFSCILYSFVMIALLDPEISWPKKIGSGTKPLIIGRNLLTIIVTFLFAAIALSLATNIPLYYAMIPYFIPLVGKIDPVIGIGVFLSAFAWVFRMRKRYLVSSMFGDVLLLLVVFSLVWNSLLVPIYPFTLPESILVQIIIAFSLKVLFMLIEWTWEKRHTRPAS